MKKLGIVREDITPTEEIEGSDKIAFECDNEKQGQSGMIDRAFKKIDKPTCSNCKCGKY